MLAMLNIDKASKYVLCVVNIDIKRWEDQKPLNFHNMLNIQEVPEAQSTLGTLKAHKAYKVLKIYGDFTHL